MSVLFRATTDNETQCDNCNADIYEGENAYCDKCYEGAPAGDLADWLRDLAYDLRDAGVADKFVRRVLDKLDSLD